MYMCLCIYTSRSVVVDNELRLQHLSSKSIQVQENYNGGQLTVEVLVKQLCNQILNMQFPQWSGLSVLHTVTLHKHTCTHT